MKVCHCQTSSSRACAQSDIVPNSTYDQDSTNIMLVLGVEQMVSGSVRGETKGEEDK